MAEIHVATSSPLVKELVADALDEFDVWARHAPNQAVSVYPDDPLGAVKSALYDVRTEMGEHLQIRLAVTLAAHGIAIRDL